MGWNDKALSLFCSGGPLGPEWESCQLLAGLYGECLVCSAWILRRQKNLLTVLPPFLSWYHSKVALLMPFSPHRYSGEALDVGSLLLSPPHGGGGGLVGRICTLTVKESNHQIWSYFSACDMATEEFLRL
jgi:hypothetical protein